MSDTNEPHGGSTVDPPHEPSGGTAFAYWPQAPDQSAVVVDFPSGDPRTTEAIPTAGHSTRANALQEERHERRRQAYVLWLQNVPQREIAKHLGVSHTTVQRHIEAYRAAINGPRQETVSRRRDQLVHQHAAAQRTLWTIAADPEVPPQARVMACSELTRSLAEVGKLTGAHMPIKVAATTPDGEHWAPLAATVLKQFNLEELKVLEKAAKLKLLAEPVIDGQVVASQKKTVTGA